MTTIARSASSTQLKIHLLYYPLCLYWVFYLYFPTTASCIVTPEYPRPKLADRNIAKNRTGRDPPNFPRQQGPFGPAPTSPSVAQRTSAGCHCGRHQREQQIRFLLYLPAPKYPMPLYCLPLPQFLLPSRPRPPLNLLLSLCPLPSNYTIREQPAFSSPQILRRPGRTAAHEYQSLRTSLELTRAILQMMTPLRIFRAGYPKVSASTSHPGILASTSAELPSSSDVLTRHVHLAATSPAHLRQPGCQKGSDWSSGFSPTGSAPS